MKGVKALIVAATTAGALALTVPAFAAAPPFPMNPYPAPSVDYTVELQTLYGHGSKVKPAVFCAESSVFRRGQQIVFRMVIVNAKTGKVQTGKDLSRVVLKIAGQPDLVVPYRPQGGNPDATSPWMWSKAWLVPDDYPLGTFKFTIVGTVKKTGTQFTYDPVVPGTEWQIVP